MSLDDNRFDIGILDIHKTFTETDSYTGFSTVTLSSN